jgi:hypothetical protein
LQDWHPIYTCVIAWRFYIAFLQSGRLSLSLKTHNTLLSYSSAFTEAKVRPSTIKRTSKRTSKSQV